MSELYIDVGNSFIKAARKIGLDWTLVYRDSISGEESFYDWLGRQSDDIVIACSVDRGLTAGLASGELSDSGRLRLLGTRDIPADLLNYKTPDTLGMDRFITCFGAIGQGSRAVAVIDAGSACTVDFMTADGVFMGGVIMPGLDLILQASTLGLPSLPEPSPVQPEEWPGKTTLDCVSWGTTGAFLEAIRGFLSRFEGRFGAFDLMLTGGGAGLLQKHLEAEFTVKVRPHLIFEGMHEFHRRILTPRT